MKTVREDHGGSHVIIAKGREPRPPEVCNACGTHLFYTIIILPDLDIELSSTCTCGRLLICRPRSYSVSLSLPRERISA